MLPQKLKVFLPCKIRRASMQIPSRIYIDSRGNLHGRRGNLHGRRGGICMDAGGNLHGCKGGICMEGTYITFRGNLK